MTKEEILNKYYILAESQEEFDKILEIYDEYKGIFKSRHYLDNKENLYFYNCYDLNTSRYLLKIGNVFGSDNKKHFITFDKLLDLLDDNIVNKLVDLPILVETREEWNNVISYFSDNNVEINFSVGDFEPGFYLVYDSQTEFLEWTETITVFDEYKESIKYIDFYKLTNTTTTEELTKDKLKDLVIKYLIKDKDVNNSYSDLLDFVNEIDKRFDLRIL